MALNKPQETIIVKGRGMSAAEAARLLRDLNREMVRLVQEIESTENMKVLTLSRVWDRDYWRYILILPKNTKKWPPYYKVEIDGKKIIIRFSQSKMPGFRKTEKRGPQGKGSYTITIPTRLLKQLGDVEPGPVLAEIASEDTVIVYL